MTGRPVTLQHESATRPRRSRRLGLTLLALLILAVGIVIGNRLAGDEQAAQQQPTTIGAQAPPQSTAAQGAAPASTRGSQRSMPSRTEAGAAEAASNVVSAFDLPIVLDEKRLRSTIAEIATREYQQPLLQAYLAGADTFRKKLGLGSTPEPVVFVRTTPLGFRVERFTSTEAIVAVWTVGVIGSGATVSPQQTWSTQRVSLTWENGGWKVSGFDREAGPTPPLARAEAEDSPSTLFQAIPAFEPYRHATP